MIGLPETYRFTVYNGCGVALAAGAVKVYARRRKIGMDGSLTFESAEATVFSNAASLANGAYEAGATVSNGTDKWLSGDFIFEVTATGAPAGDVYCYFERSTDSGSAHWPDQGLGAVIVKLYVNTAVAKRIDFTV